MGPPLADSGSHDPLSPPGRHVLLVSSDEGLRSDMSGWLEAAGHDVMSCPGPRHPRYSCVGLHGESCALERAAEVCIVDLHPVGDELVDRSSRVELVRLYGEGGRPVVVLVDGADSLDLELLGGVVTLDRTVDPRTLVSIVSDLTR